MDDIDNANECGSMCASTLLLASLCCGCDRHCDNTDKADTGADDDVKADTTIFPLPPLFGSVVIVVVAKKSTRNHPKKEPTTTLFHAIVAMVEGRNCMMVRRRKGEIGICGWTGCCV